jgi:hypothetical protein
LGTFEIGSSIFAWGWLWTRILLISAFWVARIYRREALVPSKAQHFKYEILFNM